MACPVWVPMSLSGVVRVASYTVDPVIAELAKVAAVVVWGLVAAVRATWGFTDLVLVAAAETGFGITENLLRYGGASHRVLLGGPLGDWTLPSDWETEKVPLMRGPQTPGPTPVPSTATWEWKG
jgi:hypothetical protein